MFDSIGNVLVITLISVIATKVIVPRLNIRFMVRCLATVFRWFVKAVLKPFRKTKNQILEEWDDAQL